MRLSTILVNNAFTNDWFNKTSGLNLQNDQLDKLHEIATTSQLFKFNGKLYEQTDGVAMGSPWPFNGESPHVPPRRATHTQWLDA